MHLRAVDLDGEEGVANMSDSRWSYGSVKSGFFIGHVVFSKYLFHPGRYLKTLTVLFAQALAVFCKSINPAVQDILDHSSPEGGKPPAVDAAQVSSGNGMDNAFLHAPDGF